MKSKFLIVIVALFATFLTTPVTAAETIDFPDTYDLVMAENVAPTINFVLVTEINSPTLAGTTIVLEIDNAISEAEFGCLVNFSEPCETTAYESSLFGLVGGTQFYYWTCSGAPYRLNQAYQIYMQNPS